jgi:hypothetical protein
MKGPLVIAIDGPSAAGKGTLARRLAAHFRLPHLDTGLLYRAVGLLAEKSGEPSALGPGGAGTPNRPCRAGCLEGGGTSGSP